jgi:uncharacterized membrane protein HdeD (DUF308 family)
MSKAAAPTTRQRVNAPIPSSRHARESGHPSTLSILDPRFRGVTSRAARLAGRVVGDPMLGSPRTREAAMSSIQPTGNADLRGVIAKAMHEHWKWFLIEGLILLVLGAAAIAIPPLAGLAATIWLGWLFVIGGVVGLVSTVRARGVPGFGWALVSAIVALAAGAMLLWNPMRGLVTLTYVLIAFFIIDGVVMIILALAHRRELSGRWQWMAFNGALDIVLAAIIISGLPGSLAWALGLLLGIDLLFGGAALIAMALEARKTA